MSTELQISRTDQRTEYTFGDWRGLVELYHCDAAGRWRGSLTPPEGYCGAKSVPRKNRETVEAKIEGWIAVAKAETAAGIRRVITAVHGGETLCKSLRRKERGETEVRFFLEPSGCECGKKTAEAAIATGLLKPNDDGLFDSDTSQTWVAP